MSRLRNLSEGLCLRFFLLELEILAYSNVESPVDNHVAVMASIPLIFRLSSSRSVICEVSHWLVYPLYDLGLLKNVVCTKLHERFLGRVIREKL